MKKLLVISIALFMIPSFSFGAGLFPADLITLSNGVSGSYFTDANADAVEYSLSTGHAQGNRVFFSSSNDSQIYYNDLDVRFASGTHLLQSHEPSFASESASYDGTL